MYPYQFNGQYIQPNAPREPQIYENMPYNYTPELQNQPPQSYPYQEEIPYVDSHNTYTGDQSHSYHLFPLNQPVVQQPNFATPTPVVSFPPATYRHFSNPQNINTSVPLTATPEPLSPSRGNRNYEAAAFPGPPIYYSNLKEGIYYYFN